MEFLFVILFFITIGCLAAYPEYKELVREAEEIERLEKKNAKTYL